MGDRMTPISFAGLMEWILTEKKESGKVFGLRRMYHKEDNKVLPIFLEKLETPFGPAAGPNTQLAQNIITAYLAGSRFFELKTVQILDGEDLPVNKPCILADDECYNCEWSTELYVPQAFDEYVKAWVALKVLSREFSLGQPDGFVFNMSVGYDLAGIQTEKIDRFIESLKDASDTPVFKECKEYLLSHLDQYQEIDQNFVENISPHICTSATLSTLHGCPPQEIERIASYLITEKGLHTYIKCNPTLLGYEKARKIMDDMGYDYVAFGDFHFKDDLQFEDAAPMIGRLQKLAKERGLEFGVKITNTFPVDVTRKELPSEEMYMSGRSLYALSMNVARMLAERFEGKLRISYSGGADYFNIDRIFDAGIWPITMATTLLKPGGYQRLTQIAKKLEGKNYQAFERVDVAAVQKLCESVYQDGHYTKQVKALPSRKMERKVPLVNCFTAPCSEGCPIHQDIPAYVKLAGEGNYKEALQVIMDKNPLPFMTGTICSHRCMTKCTRNFYEESVQIRQTKLEAARQGYQELLASLKPKKNSDRKVAVIGGGPAGMAAAYFLAREGVSVALYEKEKSLGGVVRHVIPDFRIEAEDVEKDVSFLKAMGVKIFTGHAVASEEELKREGFDAVILAVGASGPGTVKLEEGEAQNGIAFLKEYKAGNPKLGENVAVIGGGNTAMDVARAAARVPGVAKVSLVYRRDRRNMPADEEELSQAISDGVEFCELMAPVSHKNGRLLCNVMKLGEADASGRRKPVETGETTEVAADTVIAAVGEKVDTTLYQAFGLTLDEYGKALADAHNQGSKDHIYLVGDGLHGPATVVEAIRDARVAADAILQREAGEAITLASEVQNAARKKGILVHAGEDIKESERCLECNHICECCADVCPNRANVAIRVPGMLMPQILHVDKMCNECGNCKSFCPYNSAPYREKFTLFQTEQDFSNSENDGFYVIDGENPKERIFVKLRLSGTVGEYDIRRENKALDQGLAGMIEAVCTRYGYLLKE